MERSRNLRILVVDDDDVVGRSVSRFLARAGHAVTVTKSLGAAREELACGDRFDVVLADLQLPDGTGLELVEELSLRGSSTQVIVLTGMSEVTCGDVMVLTKPVVPSALLRAIDDRMAATTVVARAGQRYRRETIAHA